VQVLLVGISGVKIKICDRWCSASHMASNSWTIMELGEGFSIFMEKSSKIDGPENALGGAGYKHNT